MKTYKILIVLAALLAVFTLSLSAQREFKIFLNDVELQNIQAKEIDGHVMLPAEEIFEALGAKFSVHKDNDREVLFVMTDTDRSVTLFLNSPAMIFNPNFLLQKSRVRQIYMIYTVLYRK